VLAYDITSSPVDTNVYIDSQWVGYAFDTFTVAQGTHTLEVDNPGWSWYYGPVPFYYYQYDGGYSYDNPMTLWVTSDTTVTAIYVVG
jgi:hypothetical protein